MRDFPADIPIYFTLRPKLILVIQLCCCVSSSFQDKMPNSTFNDDKLSDHLPTTVCVDNFKTLRLENSLFVDKSEMINEYLERGGVVLIITKPKKWGKSINISMFKYFFDIELDENGVAVSDENKRNNVLFTGGNVKLDSGKVINLSTLKIAQYLSAMEHQGSNPVVLVSFKDVKGNSYKDFKNSIRNKIEQLFKAYPYLNRYMRNTSQPNLTDSEEINILDNIKLENSLYYLSKLLFRHFKRNVYIFIDDFDTPIINAVLTFGTKSDEFSKVINMIYQLLKKTFKDNYYLERGILTGIFHFCWLNEILHLSSVRHSTFIDTTFSKFYGFTEGEIKTFLLRFSNNVSLDQIREWYGGYGIDGENMYNPWSVLSCLNNKGDIGYYWQNAVSSADEFVDRVFSMDSAQDYLHQLLQEKIIIRKDINKPINLQNMEDTFHRPLLYGGYFNSVSSTCDAHCYIHPWNLSLPNREVRGMVATGVSKWVANKLNISLCEYFNLTNLLATFQVDDFTKTFQKFLLKSSLSKTMENQQYHQLMGGMFSSLTNRFTVQSQRKLGQRSREYILVSYPDCGHDMIIIEYKVSKAAKNLPALVESGLNRMKHKQYTGNTTKYEHVQRFIKIYMGISRKKNVVRYEIS